MTSVFHRLLETQAFVDVTLACENNYLKAHKVSIKILYFFPTTNLELKEKKYETVRQKKLKVPLHNETAYHMMYIL